MSNANSIRAEERRRRWVGGVARSFEEAWDADLAFWQKASPSERLTAIWLMAQEAALLEEPDAPAPRLQRSLGGVRRFGS